MSFHDNARQVIVHPGLIDAFDADWYYPWLPSEWHPDDYSHPNVQAAIEEGWSEWIESQVDMEAVKQGCFFDLSRDRKGDPVYWHKGSWCRWQETKSGRRLIKIPIEKAELGDEPEVVYFGRGDIACRFAETFLRNTKESKASKPGDPYRLIHWQRKFLLSVFGWVRWDTDGADEKVRARRYLQALLEVSKKAGKLLADDTPVPTPTGWKNHGDLRVGDELFDANGNIVNVIFVHPKSQATKRVVFTNGEAVDCSEEHLWVTETIRQRPGYVDTGDRPTFETGCPYCGNPISCCGLCQKHYIRQRICGDPTLVKKVHRNSKRLGAYYLPEAKETREIEATLMATQALNHRIAMHGGIECGEANLPVDPYFLGYWLGDGSSYRCHITMNKLEHREICGLLEGCGVWVRESYESRGKFSVSFDDKRSNKRDHNSLWEKIVGLGLARNKHIPANYLRASKTQRISMLQGLLDSDGTVSKRGEISFAQKSTKLTDGFCELLSSLGIKYNRKLVRKKCTNNGKVGKYWSVRFAVFRDEILCFKLSRKLDRMRSRSDLQMRTGRSRHVHIKAVEDIDPVQGNCITVSGDGTYLCGKTMLPTHNSDLGSIITLILIQADNTRKAYVYGVASDKRQAGIIFREAKDYVEHSPDLKRQLFVNDSRMEQAIHHKPSGSQYEVVSADAHRNDGYDAHGVVFDELHQQRNRQLYVIFRRSGQARLQPLEFVSTTYGRTLKSIWGEVHLKAKAILQEQRMKTTQFVMIASAEPIPVLLTEDTEKGATLLAVRRLEQPIDVGERLKFVDSETSATVVVELTREAKRFQRFLEVQPLSSDLPRYSEATANEDALNPDRLDHAIRRANPSVDIVTSHERIKQTILDAEGPQAEAEAKRFNLNIVAGDGELWLSGAAWMAGGRKRILPSSLLGQRCFGGLDLSETIDLTAFWLAFPNWKRGVKWGKVKNPRIRLLGFVWLPSEGLEKREEVEEIPYRALAEKRYFGDFGCVRICDGATVNYEQVGEDIVSICEFFQVKAIASDPHKLSEIAEPYLRPNGLRIFNHRQGSISMGPPSRRFAYLVRRHMLDHGDHPVLNAAVEGCVLSRPDVAGNRHPAKDKSISRIDPLVAAIMATGWACNPPEELRATGAWSGRSGSGAFSE